MKKISIIILSLLCTILYSSCGDEKEILIYEEENDQVSTSVKPITDLIVKQANEKNEIALSWKNPWDKDLQKVEISYKVKDVEVRSSANPTVLSIKTGTSSSTTITVPTKDTYVITVVAINIGGARSEGVSAESLPFEEEEEEEEVALAPFLNRTDILMTSITDLFFGGSYNVWRDNYPKTDGYWDGSSVIWGQGAAFSGYAATRKATIGTTLEKKYADQDRKFLESTDRFRNSHNGTRAEAYGTYMGENDERYYDDNVWVGIDMVDLYVLTKNKDYLDRAEMVWKFLLVGTDDVTGGGIYWNEDSQSKHTCSTAPAAVMAAKMYQATQDEKYLISAKELYAWCKNVVQDPSDYLYWDSARLNDENEISIDKAKYSYNSGQPIQAAALLYKITGEEQYLTDAQDVAKAAYKKWSMSFYSIPLGKQIQMLSVGHIWFYAVTLRGYIELYSIDGNRTYIDMYENTLTHAWLSNARDERTDLLNNDFRGGSTKNSWDILSQGAFAEMLARLAIIEKDESPEN